MTEPRRLSPVQAAIGGVLAQLDGERLPSGCELCDARETVEPVAPGLWTLNISHDPGCPELRRAERER